MKDAGVKGKGVFASKEFLHGDVILKIDTSALISAEDIQYLSADEQNHTMYVGDGNYIIMGSPERFINHSCEANAYTKSGKVIAMRDIKQGEEITCDYSLTSVDTWKMKCFCGSKRCRGVIEGDLLQKDASFRRKHTEYIEEWMKREILEKR